jgi:hypothetical protein
MGATMRRAAKIDDNQPELTRALKWTGAGILYLHQLGRGCPDALVGLGGLTLVGRFDIEAARRALASIPYLTIHSGANLLMEIKDGTKSASRRALTEDEARWHQNWPGQVAIAATMEEALQLAGQEALI